MAYTADGNSFVDTIIARLIALVIGLLIAFFIWSKWSTDIQMVFSGDAETTEVVSVNQPAKPANAALDACLAQRLGDVDGMKEDGIISDAQYEAFSKRARGLCVAQNPGG